MNGINMISAELDRLLQVQKADDKGVYLSDWSGKDEMLNDFFRLPYIEKTKRAKIEADTASVEILLAYYLYEDYSGEAFVLFRQNGKLYEVNGSHCSCYGLEDQWQPEETDVASLRHRLDSGDLGQDYNKNNKFANELRAVLNGIASAAIAA